MEEVPDNFSNKEVMGETKGNEVDKTINVELTVEKPAVGMSFSSVNDFLEFYARYGKELGFGGYYVGILLWFYYTRRFTKYILRRWNKNIKRRHTKIKISYDERSTKPESRRFDELCNAFEEVADMVVDCEDRYKELMVHVHTLKEKFSHDNGACGSAKPVSKKNTVSPAYGDGQNILTPLAVRCRGRGPFKRKQTNLEKIVQRLNKGKKNMKTSPSKENAKKDFHSLNFEEGRNMLNASNAPAYDQLTV
ncbi:hypothetical protein IFM89_015042 [Coptis chinensis]|uniref:Protein FAR1-RELATED SEQUENCE n=1 Tax=Coptis chinensis TaxID=261450 RepID=A0A835H3C0_9MAGN|nr:hypothetical protein IFM89_015042 [Coptis chinensis]